MEQYGQSAWVNITHVCVENSELVGAVILEPSMTYELRRVAALATRSAAIDVFMLTLVPPLAANLSSQNPTHASELKVGSYAGT